MDQEPSAAPSSQSQSVLVTKILAEDRPMNPFTVDPDHAKADPENSDINRLVGVLATTRSLEEIERYNRINEIKTKFQLRGSFQPGGDVQTKRTSFENKREDNRAYLRQLTQQTNNSDRQKSVNSESEKRMRLIEEIIRTGSGQEDSRPSSNTFHPVHQPNIYQHTGEVIPEEDEDAFVMDEVQRNIFMKALRQEDLNYSDCGKPGQGFTLSRQFSRYLRKAKHLGFFGLDGHKHFYSLRQSFGHHHSPLIACHEQRPQDCIDCGLGVGMYFKFVKAFASTLIVMTLITTASLVLLTQKYQKSPDTSFIQPVLSLSPIAATTVASVLRDFASCRRVEENSVFAFGCPSGMQISQVNALYGNPRPCTALNPTAAAPSATCDSSTALPLANALCSGRSSCSFNISVCFPCTLQLFVTLNIAGECKNYF